MFQKDTYEATVEANAAALAQLEVIDKILELDPLDIEAALEQASEQ